MKLLIGNVYNFQLSQENQKNLEWRPLSTDILKTSITLPFWMIFGPRLNTHAIIATVGPFKVNKTIEICVQSAEESAQEWTIVVYKFPDYETIVRIGTGENKIQNQWEAAQVEPGIYMLGLRYYNWQEKVELPAIKVDEFEIVKSKSIPANINNFYYDLKNQNNLFYLLLQYYIFIILQFKNLLPESFLKKEFLPVGDPAINYFYGHIKKGQSIHVELDSLIFNSYEVYLTMYNRASFPEFFYQIKEEKHITKTSEFDGFYLFRIRQKSMSESKFLGEWVNINLTN
ncbi:hypothetical protein IQ243_01890 [Nostocales cyanobacterium LEGE 11386]|nr:hypothetical protein [Nostocales cyanobacterium LEGE 11386]